MRNTLLTYCILFTFAMVISAQEQNPPVSSTIQHRKAPDIQQKSNNNSIQIESASWRISQYFQKFTPIKMSMVGLNLLCDTNSLQHDIDCSIEVLNKSQVPVLSANLINVTGGSPGYRILPNGEHFTPPATLEIEYDANSLPIGFKPNDVYTYYYNENMQRWEVLPRIGIDTIRQMIISKTTHFTDFINAVIRTPDMPEVSASVPTMLKDMEEPHPFSSIAMVSEPESNAQGTAEVTYPVAIPFGRNGLQPDVSLSYSSMNGNGILGYGWSMSQPAVTIDTRWGVPRYDATYETEIYTVNGQHLVQKDNNPDMKLPYQTNVQRKRETGDVRFIVRDTRNGDRVIRHGNSPATYWWEVTNRNGTTYYYGKYQSDSGVNGACVLKNASGNIGYWALAEVVDLAGNYIRYEYAVSPSREIYPKAIFYTGHKTSDGTIDLHPNYRVFFHYDTRADILRDGRLGFVRQTDSIMCYIDIQSLPIELSDNHSWRRNNHRFLLSYNNEESSISLLTQIQDYFNCYAPWRIDEDCTLPTYGERYLNGTTNFDYHTPTSTNIFSEDIVMSYSELPYTALGASVSDNWSVGGTATVGFGAGVWNTNLSVGGNYNYSQSKGRTEQMLLDINGDGLADIVYVKDNTIHFQPQQETDKGAAFGNEINTGIPAKGLSMDISKTHTWGLQAGVEVVGVNGNASGGESYTDTYTSCYFADVNGDGLPDYIDDGKVYFNRLATYGGFVEHSGEEEVIIDSTRCMNFYYDGEVEVIPDCIVKDSIVATYVFYDPDCIIDYEGTEPDYTEKPFLDYRDLDCEECKEIILEYLRYGYCPLDLHSSFIDYSLRRTPNTKDSMPADSGAPSEGDEMDLETHARLCLRYCNKYEPVCDECLDYYEWYLMNPSPETKALYQSCMRENGCRTICPECYDYLLDGDEYGYLACADTFCLSGMLQGMQNPCDDCHDICVDDIENCKDCIESNPTCFVCDECRDICINEPDNCNQCKLEYNCIGAITSRCEDRCLNGFDAELEDCADCLVNEGSYCEECREICMEHPENCFYCVNRRCHYADTEAYVNDCWDEAWGRYYSWKNKIRQKYHNIVIKKEGNTYYAHQIDTICPENPDPEIEAVRVWVAPQDGVLSLHSDLQLIEDTSYARRQARQVDGVQCIIQHNKNVSIDAQSHALKARTSTILDKYTISQDDYSRKTKTYPNTTVKKGDVFFFHVRSVRTHNFDNVRWEQTFTYNDGSRYSSTEDFICSSDEVFQYEQNGTIVLNTDVICPATSTATLTIRVDGQPIDSIPLNASVSHSRKAFSYQGGTSVSVELSSAHHIGQIEVKPYLTFTTQSSDNDSPSFSRWLPPHVLFTKEVELDSLYYYLFGPLYKGWGQFAYNNANAVETIPIQSLSNTTMEYAQKTSMDTSMDSAAFCQSITFTESDTLQLMQPRGMETAFATRNLYNPLDNAWIQMTPDISQYRWEAYGRVARNGRHLLSNTRDTKTMVSAIGSNASIADNEEVDYDSEVPVSANGQRVTAVRKESRTKQWNVNIGAGVLLVGTGKTRSESTYSVTTDFMDMNGDNYPDVVRTSTIQYTTPWGGLGANKKVNAAEAYANHSLSQGGSISGGYAHAIKAPGVNVKDGKFITHVGGSISGNATNSYSQAAVAYIDINGDGLPDKLTRQGNKIRAWLNIGYGFAPSEVLWDISLIDDNFSSCMGVGLGASGDLGWGDIKEVITNVLGTPTTSLTSLFQMSLTFGADVNYSTNTIEQRLIDMNGDGIPDVVRQTADGFLVMFMSSQGTYQQFRSSGQIQKSETLHWGMNIGGTGGFPVWFMKICIGANGSPYGSSTTKVLHDLVDMNGDGLPDIVWMVGDSIHVRYNQFGKSRLLKTITNPTGQRIELDYELSPPTCEQRGRRWLMNSICNIDPHAHPILGCDTMMHTYSYADPHYDYAERQFLGYGTTVSHDINTDTLPHTVYRKTIRRYNNTDLMEHGKLLYEALADADGNLFSEYEIGTWYVDSTFTPTDNLCSDASIRVGTEVHYTRYYEGGTEHIVTAKKYEYDRYHNVTNYINMGDSLLADDDLSASIEYDSTAIATHNLISSPTRMVVYNNGTAVREWQVDYEQGRPQEIKQIDRLNNQEAVTNYHYDAFGMPDSVVFPSNHKEQRAFTTVTYDDYSHTLPAVVKDQWGRTTQTSYDKFLQRPSTIRDPAGNTIRYNYDWYGRLKKVTSPQQYATIEYLYAINQEKNGIRYSSVQTSVISSTYTNWWYYNEYEMLKYTYCDSRGNMVFREESGYDTFTEKELYICSDVSAKDCFGRTKTMYRNFLDTLKGYATIVNADHLTILSTIDYDVRDRQTRIRWQDNTQQTSTYSLAPDAWGAVRLCQTTTDELGRSSHTFSTPQGWATTTIAPNNTVTSCTYDALGQWLSSTDPDGISTAYQYDGFGRIIERYHPDAGITRWTYDNAGNKITSTTQRQIDMGTQTEYEYDYNRLQVIHQPQYPQTDVTYTYDAAGRVEQRTDITGYEKFQYDDLGNVSQSERVIVVPTENQAYRFTTGFTYDALGAIMDIIYPDSEMVEYHYREGKLHSVASIDYRNDSVQNIYLNRINYDAYNHPSKIEFANEHTTEYFYDPNRNWLTQQKTNKGENVLQDLHYTYDAVGNITSVEQTANRVRWLGGPYILDYQYDSLNRLTKADMVSDYFGLYSNYTMSYSPSGLVGLKSCDDMLWNYWYGYNTNSNGTLKNHQVRSIYDMENDETAFLQWDANGQLQNVLRPCSGDMRHHWWNESGQMVASVDNERCGYYGYNGNGERVYKLTGQSLLDQYNAGEQNFRMFFNDAVLYVNPFMVVTPKGYTKHYYNGSQHIAAQIGKLEDLPDDIIDTSAVAMERIANARAYMNVILNISETQPIDSTSVFADIDGDALDELQWQCNDEEWTLNATVHCDSNMLQPILTKDSAHLDRRVSGIYYYHPDHLGSATWITNSSGVPIQFIHYMPWGEMWYNQQASAYNERFKFTGKERDTETGYDYFGARYYSSALPMWLSVDPLSDKYPNISPYAYCNWNPVNNIDIHGDSVSFSQIELFDKTCGTNTLENILNDLQSITGLTLSLNNGVLNYAKNENGDAVTNGGSETARNQLISLISNTKMANVGIGRRSLALNNDIILAPKQIDRFINGSMGVDSRTLGYGMTFLHESFHTNIGGGLKDNPNATGPVVDNMNLIRSELNNIGYNFGQRMSYSAIFTHGQNYIPFNNAAQNSLNAGLLPCTLFGMQFIHF